MLFVIWFHDVSRPPMYLAAPVAGQLQQEDEQVEEVETRKRCTVESSKGPHEYHILTTIFETASATRVPDAAVTAKVWGLGLLGREAKLEPMNIADATAYGAFFYLPGVDVYAIQLTIKRSSSQRSVVLNFNYDHCNQ